jgi:hypothetical protein
MTGPGLPGPARYGRGPGSPGPTLGAIAALLAVATLAATATPAFERVIAPFPILDPSGRAYALPLLGGLDVPRPQFVDIDADGDLDLFIQEYSNQLWFFENVAGAGAPAYEWRTNRYQNLEIGEWYRFVDVDGDGRIDLLSELPFSNIRYYRNTGTPARAAFELAGPLRDSAGEPIFLDRQNIPALVDLDCDRRLDLFVGRIEGTVARYEADGPGADRFSLIAERFEGIEIVGGGGFGTARHGANALAFADFDGDQDPDLFWGDFFEAGMLLIENIGRTCSTPSFQVEPVLLPFAGSTRTSGYNAPAPVDLDGDGDLDFLMGVLGGSFNPVATSADNFYYWERTSPAALELRTRRFLDGLDLGSETAPAAVDLDADGDLDLVVGNKIDPAAGDAGRLTTFVNEGSAKTPRYRQGEAIALGGAYHLVPAAGDLDADGDPDLLVGTWNQDILFVRNTGTRTAPTWTVEAAGAVKLARGSNAAPALADIDGDGDLDLFVGQANGAVSFYRNDGSRRAPKFVLAVEQLGGIRAGRRSAPALVDLDGDKRLDLVIGREGGGAAVFRDGGGRGEPQFTEWTGLDLPLPSLATPVFADFDGDGAVDVLTGASSGGLTYWRGRR